MNICHTQLFLGLFLVAGLMACNKDNFIEIDDPALTAVAPQAPPLPDTSGSFDDVFPSPSYFYRSTTRYTFVGRPVFLTPKVDGQSFSWTVDGDVVDCSSRTFIFTPDAPGHYNICVTIDGSIVGQVKVACVSATENENYRSGTSTSTVVYEYVPAPGQFVNEENSTMTPDEAAYWAAKRLATGDIVSLGAFGGYIIVGFDHSIGDFLIKGNAFTGKNGASNEPGIVYVMQDVNGNGLPDDEWYELRASETDKDGVIQEYAVTYNRPGSPKSAVSWIDNFGSEGTIDYMSSYHSQDSYYPSWIDAEQYTLSGSCVAVDCTRDAVGQWIISPLEWGYADNTGSNNDLFHISDAMYADHSTVALQYIDFIKIMTAVSGKCGSLGELSTEVCKVEIK